MKKTILALLAISLLLASTALAARRRPIQKRARKGDVATTYTLAADGGLFRQIGKNRCQITDRADDLKIAMHPRDRAVLYFVKEGNLHILKAEAPGVATDSCPRAETEQLLAGVTRYSLAPTTSPVVAVAMASDGRFLAWNDQATLVFLESAKDFVMNTCYGVKGKAFNTYVAFVIDATGHVVKLKGDESGALKGDMDATYTDLGDFKVRNKVCQRQ